MSTNQFVDSILLRVLSAHNMGRIDFPMQGLPWGDRHEHGMVLVSKSALYRQ